jgi:hypothetical protein
MKGANGARNGGILDRILCELEFIDRMCCKEVVCRGTEEADITLEVYALYSNSPHLSRTVVREGGNPVNHPKSALHRKKQRANCHAEPHIVIGV